jgi:transcriptional regulator with XRE-family HTH domain
MNIKKNLGAKIKYLRKQNKYSQEKFSELVDLNPRQIVRIENGESMPSIDNLEKIAKVLNVEVEELFINSSFDDEEILRKKICDKTSQLQGNSLRALYIMAMNL